MSENEIHRKLRVTGRVQGVFYRATTMDKALELGLFGFVRNEPDGSVYIEVEGSEGKVNRLIEWCKAGPSFATVDDVYVEEGEIENFVNFQIDRL